MVHVGGYEFHKMFVLILFAIKVRIRSEICLKRVIYESKGVKTPGSIPGGDGAGLGGGGCWSYSQAPVIVVLKFFRRRFFKE